MSIQFFAVGSKRAWIILIIAAIIGVGLHFLFWESRVQLLSDQVRDAIIVEQLAHGDPAGRGPSSSFGGMHLGPFFYYLLFPFLAITGFSPFGGVLFGTAMYALTIPLLFILLRKMTTEPIALIGTLLFAGSEVIFIFTQFIWNPNALFPFVALWLLLMLYLYTHDVDSSAPKGKLHSFFWHGALGIIVGVLSQLHFIAGIALLITAGVIALSSVYSWKYRVMHIIAWMLGVMLSYAPYIAAQVALNYEDVHRFIAFIQSDSTASPTFIQFFTIAFDRFQIVLQNVLLSLYIQPPYRMDRALPFLVLLLIIGGISAAVHSKQATQRLMARIVLATLLIGLVGMSVIPIFFVHYTLFWIIPMIVLLCLALDALSEWRPAVTKGILIMLALFAVWNVTSSVMHITAIREGEEVLEYGYRYPYMREVADYLITHPEIKSIACSEEQACIVIPYLVEKEGRSVSTVGIEQADVFIQDLRHGEQRPVPSTEILLRNRLYTVLDLY